MKMFPYVSWAIFTATGFCGLYVTHSVALATFGFVLLAASTLILHYTTSGVARALLDGLSERIDELKSEIDELKSELEAEGQASTPR